MNWESLTEGLELIALGMLGSVTTKAFRSGNFQAIQIPPEIAYGRADINLDIQRIGDELRIRPARGNY
ncbi:hypothetical protein SAMN05428959_1011246 [Duganella sp. CF517]|uniref:hypothetical protein n=1 Tax=Duganella sp. CF517 TaxID=1881038 RepID=UPI0008AFC396|nr:hypothetical protein [Duganella sp. CF517]SEN33777.1 hypothetical protein SAMN05428959_1011246 [Duganella sp. CF517]